MGLKLSLHEFLFGLTVFLISIVIWFINKSKWEKILQFCSFDYMKMHGGNIVPFGGDLWRGGEKAFMHKGINGRWKDVLTGKDIELYEKVARMRLGAACANWLSKGGPLGKKKA